MKQYLFSCIEKIVKHLGTASHCILFLDYDGTLVPICKEPSLARLSLETKKVLKDLSSHPGFSVGIISGRSLGEIRQMVGIRDLLYAGNHGFEIMFQKRAWTHPGLAELVSSLKGITRNLKKQTRGIKGIFVEDKKLTVSVHYRNVKDKSPGAIFALINESLEPYSEAFTIARGKKVFEVRPLIAWDKGRAVDRLTQLLAIKTKLIRVYIGDDQTDEDAFSVLGENDISIRVGYKKGSRAQYYCRGSGEVVTFLKMLSDVKSAQGK